MDTSTIRFWVGLLCLAPASAVLLWLGVSQLIRARRLKGRRRG